MWIFIQARTASTRLRNKVMALIDGQPIIGHVWDKCQQVCPGRVAVLIPFNDPLKEYLFKENMLYIEGPEDDVLQRYQWASRALNAQWVMRITADCPMLDTAVMFYMAAQCMSKRVDFMTNLPCPDGYDCEIMSARALLWTHQKAVDPKDREHVTTFIKNNMDVFKSLFNTAKYKAPYELKWFPKLSIDTEKDLNAIRGVYERIKKI